MFYNIVLICFMFIILMNIRRTKTSLLSRFRNPNEYVPRDASKYFFPEDLDDDQYTELIEEVPELAGKLRYNQYEGEQNTLLPFIRKEVNGSFEMIPTHEEFDAERDDDQEEYPGQLEYVTVTQGPKKTSLTSRQLPFLAQMPLNSSEDWARRQNIKPEKFFFKPKRMANCYWCGLNLTRIPTNSLCYDAFESPDWRARTLARYFRAHCLKSYFEYVGIRHHKYSRWTHYYTDNGLIRLKYGPYVGGCFKRFLDVGKIYTQRGCRRVWPEYPRKPNFVGHRYTRLEFLIRKEKDYCIVSPHASLTPFSRAISLFVRYHVCVCAGRYCNDTTRPQCCFTLITLIIITFTLMRF